MRSGDDGWVIAKGIDDDDLAVHPYHVETGWLLLPVILDQLDPFRERVGRVLVFLGQRRRCGNGAGQHDVVGPALLLIVVNKDHGILQARILIGDAANVQAAGYRVLVENCQDIVKECADGSRFTAGLYLEAEIAVEVLP